MREYLLGYLLGVLDESEQIQVEKRLQQDSKLRDELKQLDARLEPLRAIEQPFAAPVGLAERTCELIRVRAKKDKVHLPAGNFSASNQTRSRRRYWSAVDVVVAAGVVAVAAMLLFPALVNSRFHSRLTGCQNNLRVLHLALIQYADANQGFLPAIPTEGNLAFAGVYAPLLHHGGYTGETTVFICPASDMAREQHRFMPPSQTTIQSQHGKALKVLQRKSGGSYGYNLGYVVDGRYQPSWNYRRTQYAVLSDSPSSFLASRQSANHGGLGQNVMFEDGHVQYLTSLKAAVDDVFLSDRGYVEAGRHINDAVIGHSSAKPILPISHKFND